MSKTLLPRTNKWMTKMTRKAWMMRSLMRTCRGRMLSSRRRRSDGLAVGN